MPGSSTEEEIIETRHGSALYMVNMEWRDSNLLAVLGDERLGGVIWPQYVPHHLLRMARYRRYHKIHRFAQAECDADTRRSRPWFHYTCAIKYHNQAAFTPKITFIESNKDTASAIINDIN
jgi:hypothetical protein